MENTPEKQPAPAPTMGRRFLRFLWGVLPLVLVIILAAAIIIPLGAQIDKKKTALKEKLDAQKAQAKALTNVVTLEMIPELIQDKISLPGVAKPWVSLNVVAEVQGKIIEKKVFEGRYVKKGDILAVIDKSDYQNAYNSARASYETAVTNEKRMKALVQKNFATKSQLDDVSAAVKTTKAALDNAALNLERCVIVSPMSGIVDRVHIENGTFLGPGDPVAQILQINRLKISVGIPESDVDAVRKLKRFDMTVDALQGRHYTGTQHYFFKTSDSMARLYNLEIEVNNTDGAMLPDMFARVDIVKQRDENGLGVPMYSLVSRKSEVGVFVEKDSVVEFRPVETGFQDGWKVQIAKGVSPGEKVVVVGHRIIEDGETVNVVKIIRDVKELTR